MSDQSVNDAILARISKLLALADSARNTSEAEASAAAAKVQEMLQQYGLSLAEVESAGGKSAPEGQREKRSSDKHGAMYKWQIRLMTAISEGNFCIHRVHRGKDENGTNRTYHQLVGRKVNIEASQMVYYYLLGAMKRIAADEGYRVLNGVSKEWSAWMEGCSDRLVERLRVKAEEARRESEARAQATKSNGTGREFVLADVYGSEADLNNDMLNGFPAGTTATKRRENEERVARHKARWEQLQSEGVEKWEAWYIAHGYGTEDAKRLAGDFNRQVSRSGRGYRGRGWTRADERAEERRNSPAYRSGSKAGASIGLDPQVSNTERKKLT